MAAPVILIQLTSDAGPIVGRIHDYGNTGIVDIDTYPSSMGFALARAALGQAVVDGRVSIPRDAMRRFGLGDFSDDGTHRLKFTAEGSA